MTEGEDITLTVNRTNGATGEVSVNYTVTADTASASDVEGDTSGTITFASGETTKSVTVPLLMTQQSKTMRLSQ